MAKKKLKLDLDSLFPGDEIDICGNSVIVRPLGLRKLAEVLKKLKGFGDKLGDDGVSFTNYQEPSNLVKICAVLVEHFPEVLSEASGVDQESIDQLPLDITVELLAHVIDVNLKSKDKLEKNFNRLVGKVQGMTKTPKKAKSKRK